MMSLLHSLELLSLTDRKIARLFQAVTLGVLTRAPDCCVFCGLDNDDIEGLNQGRRIRFEKCQFAVHELCLLLSSNLNQRSNTGNPLMGFRMSAILAHFKDCAERTCVYCNLNGANIQCAAAGCRYFFHLPCGRRNGAFHEFFGLHKSFCRTHIPRSVVSDKDASQGTAGASTSDCLLCHAQVETRALVGNVVRVKCCATANRSAARYFHFVCMQKYAACAGSSTNCPLIPDDKAHTERFRDQILKAGIYVPNRDAAWFEADGLHTGADEQIRCTADDCLCPNGRQFAEEGADSNQNYKFEFINLCLSGCESAIHRHCAGLPWADYSEDVGDRDEPPWVCDGCDSQRPRLIVDYYAANKHVRPPSGLLEEARLALADGCEPRQTIEMPPPTAAPDGSNSRTPATIGDCPGTTRGSGRRRRTQPLPANSARGRRVSKRQAASASRARQPPAKRRSTEATAAAEDINASSPSAHQPSPVKPSVFARPSPLHNRSQELQLDGWPGEQLSVAQFNSGLDTLNRDHAKMFEAFQAMASEVAMNNALLRSIMPEVVGMGAALSDMQAKLQCVLDKQAKQPDVQNGVFLEQLKFRINRIEQQDRAHQTAVSTQLSNNLFVRQWSSPTTSHSNYQPTPSSTHGYSQPPPTPAQDYRRSLKLLPAAGYSIGKQSGAAANRYSQQMPPPTPYVYGYLPPKHSSLEPIISLADSDSLSATRTSGDRVPRASAHWPINHPKQPLSHEQIRAVMKAVYPHYEQRARADLAEADIELQIRKPVWYCLNSIYTRRQVAAMVSSVVAMGTVKHMFATNDKYLVRMVKHFSKVFALHGRGRKKKTIAYILREVFNYVLAKGI